ncbi:MAG: hypothetical protein J0M18_08305 [Ignavibacteria bacterium]|nr:hypothetical protein [Ignavibacteria bacterium]
MFEKEYNEYLQNFAIWTSARAVNRNFTKTSIIKKALISIDFYNEILNLAKRTNLSETEFDNWHSETNKKLRKELSRYVNTDKVTYGRVSKIIAIYIKTAHVLQNPGDSLSKVAHIPIDRILLNNLSMNDEHFKSLKWTLLNQRNYYNLVDKLRIRQKKEGFKYFWMLEKYWVV